VEAKDKRMLGAALYGLSYLLRHAGPSLCMADREDIETDVALHEEEGAQWKSSLYLYDAHEGGVGYAEKIFERIGDALRLCRQIIDECECDSGCPSCVPPLPPGVTNPELETFLIESDAAAVLHGEPARCAAGREGGRAGDRDHPPRPPAGRAAAARGCGADQAEPSPDQGRGHSAPEARAGALNGDRQ
jgi:hypothetical protein